jgi:hypothetical protein
MKLDNAMLTIVCLVALGLSCTNPVLEFNSPIYLTVDKLVYAPEDTIRVTLHNNSDEPVFLEGCNHLYLATKTDTGWIAPGVRCVWEGFAVKILPRGSFNEKHPPRYFRGLHKFFARVYFGCLDGKPISEAKCADRTILYSPQFAVSGYGNAAGNIEILLDKPGYSWASDDLGSSRQIQVTIISRSDRTYYANLGDGFDSSIDQDDLAVAEGSGASIERFNPDGTWSAMPRDLLIEGTRFVALRTRKSYRLTAEPLYFWDGDETGQFRIKVEYFDRIDPSPDVSPKVDYSNVFTIAMP